MFCYVTEGGRRGVCLGVTVRYKGGGRGEKSPEKALRNMWTTPYWNTLLRRMVVLVLLIGSTKNPIHSHHITLTAFQKQHRLISPVHFEEKAVLWAQRTSEPRIVVHDLTDFHPCAAVIR